MTKTGSAADGPRVVEQQYFVDGHSIEAARIYQAGPNQETIVMLHEGLGSVAQWKDFPLRLAAETGHDVFLFSRYGHGRSDRLEERRTPSYMHHEAEIVLPEILRAAGIERPVLFGHSDGASIALLFAAMFPDQPAALILEAPHVFVEDITLTSIALAKKIFEETDLPRRLGRYHADVESMFWGWNNIWLDPEFRNWNIESYLSSVRCPVLVLQGVQDEYGTPNQLQAIKTALPNAETILLDDCKHAPHRDQPELTLSAIQRFLAECGRPRL